MGVLGALGGGGLFAGVGYFLPKDLQTLYLVSRMVRHSRFSAAARQCIFENFLLNTAYMPSRDALVMGLLV
jgi:hypothetical protein